MYLVLTFTENMVGINPDNDSPAEPPVPSNVARVPEIEMVESRKQEIQIDVDLPQGRGGPLNKYIYIYIYIYILSLL